MIQKSLNCTNKSSPNILLSIWYTLYKTLKHILKRGMHYWSLIKNQFLSLSPSKVTNLSLIFAFQLELLNDTHCWGNRRQKRKVKNICCFIFKYNFYKSFAWTFPTKSFNRDHISPIHSLTHVGQYPGSKVCLWLYLLI